MQRLSCVVVGGAVVVMVRCSLAALHMVMMVATDTPHTPPANISQGQVGSHHPSRCGHSVTHTTTNHGGKYIGSSSVSRQTNHLRGISPRITQDGSLSRANIARKSTRIQVRDIDSFTEDNIFKPVSYK